MIEISNISYCLSDTVIWMVDLHTVIHRTNEWFTYQGYFAVVNVCVYSCHDRHESWYDLVDMRIGSQDRGALTAQLLNLFFISISSFLSSKKGDETRKLLVRAKCIIRRLVNTLFSDKTVRLTGLNRNWRSKFMSSETFDNFRGTLLKSFINRNVFKVRFN